MTTLVDRLLDIFTTTPEQRAALAARLANPESLDWTAFPHVVCAVDAERAACAKVLSEMAEQESRREIAAREEGDCRLADHLQGIVAYLDTAVERIRARGNA